MSARLVWTLAWKVIGVFWSVVRVAGLAETWSTLPALPSSETESVPSPLAETVIVPV